MSSGGRVSAPARPGAPAEPRLSSLLVTGIASALSFAGTQAVPALGPLALVSGVPLAVQRLRSGRVGAALATLLAGALVAAILAPGPALAFLLVLAAPALVLGEALARGRGLLRGCAWAFLLLAALAAVALLSAPERMAERVLAPLDHLRSEAFLAELGSGGVPPERVAAWAEHMTGLRNALAVVFPAAYVIAAALSVLASAGALRLYLSRRDPGWLEDGEFERVRWPLALPVAFVLSGAAVALAPARPAAYNVLLVIAFFFVLQGLAVVAFYARRLAGPPLLKSVVVVLVLVNPWAPQILALVGLFDNWLDFRRWAEPPREGR